MLRHFRRTRGVDRGDRRVVSFHATDYVTDIFEGLLNVTSVVILVSVGADFLILKGASPQGATAGGLTFGPVAAAVTGLIRVSWRVFAG